MSTDEQDGLEDENREGGPADDGTMSEETVTTEYTNLAELRCGITLRDDIETELTRQSPSSDDRE